MPRLVLAAYATVKRTDLFFRQAVGRVVRRRADDPDDLVATVFLPADPTLTGCAERVEVELRQQVSDEVGAAFDVEPPPGLAQRADFQPLDAQVEPGGMIVAGVHYARAEVDAARRLLRELGQSERALRSVLEFVRRERVGGPADRRRRPVPAHRRVEHKRRALDRLARRWAQLRREIDPDYTWPQAQARVNRAMGVRRRADAGEAATRRRPRASCARARQARRATTPSRPSDCGSPAASRASTSGSAWRPATADPHDVGVHHPLRCTRRRRSVGDVREGVGVWAGAAVLAAVERVDPRCAPGSSWKSNRWKFR